MDELSPFEADALMDLDEADGSDLDDDDDEFVDESLTSPSHEPSPGLGLTTASSSPPSNEDFLPPFNFSGKPLNSLKRGRGRPKREGGKPIVRRPGTGNRVRKARPPGIARAGSMPRRFKSIDRSEYDFGLDDMILESENGNLVLIDKPLINDDIPHAPETWPGKVCAFCNLGERSQLGQGELLRLNCPEGFIPERISADAPGPSTSMPEREAGDKSPRGPVTCRRQKGFNKCRHPSLTSEYVDELTIIGYVEEPDVSILFESVGHFYIHRSCALWSNGVIKNENQALENVGPVVLQSSSKKCSFCNHFGASVMCKSDGCNKIYHFPCATASGAFQEISTLTLYCSNHLGEAIKCDSSICYTCKETRDIQNLMYCSTCGEHYHGTCVGLAQLPGVRAGWQCRKCRLCQVCRMTGDESKLMNCEQCDKVYHAGCQRPIVTTIPKYGWKCRCCRVCGDCGSRTPGAGLSSRWHAHYTVCDSCYQQRNKGFCCPICHRAYRAHAHREMVQCTLCNKFVHGTCDSEADLTTYHQRKESQPDYEYVCTLCKNAGQSGRLTHLIKRNSIDDSGDAISASQESLYDENYEYDQVCSETAIRNIGLGKGKPYHASKIAKKRLGYGNGAPGRPKGFGKGPAGNFTKRQRLTEFGRKRGAKTKMRGMFGVPGVGLQRPVSDGKSDEEPGVENRLVLCSAKDKFVLSQDICVMCGALGTDQEGCLIACVQCGQCYHPYCVSVKITKVVLQKGWRCLDCTVCEGCGQRNDESRLILCDDCDISYHIYCMDPPLEYVPHGNWKCKWCAMCQTCGATDPGFNCNWMNSFSECGPCASHSNCPSCTEPYNEGDLIIQCDQCQRWLHGSCDLIKSDDDAEKCAEEGYTCLLCRPRDVPPPHLVPNAMPTPPTPTKSPEVKTSANYCLDGVYLSENGHHLIKSLMSEHHMTRKKRKKVPTVQDKEAGIMATIESVVAGGNLENSLEEAPKIDLADIKDEPQELYKEGMIWTKEDGPPPEGFTLFTVENGVSSLRRKRQRNLQKMGIGGFLVRVRGTRCGQDNDDIDILPGQSTSNIEPLLPTTSTDGDKPRRKPIRRKPKSKLAETFPPYLQEAFFGKELLDSTKELGSSSSDEEKISIEVDKTLQLSQDEIKAVAAVSVKKEKITQPVSFKESLSSHKLTSILKEEDNTEELKDVLALPGDFLDTDLVNTLMNDDEELSKNTDSLEGIGGSNLPDDGDLGDTLGSSGNSKDTKDELTDIFGTNFNLDVIPNINSKDVEELFKGVLTDESQESQESNVLPLQPVPIFGSANGQSSLVQHAITPGPSRPTSLQTGQSNLNSPLSFPAQSPYHSEYSNSPQFSPAFTDTSSSWVSTVNDSPDVEQPVTAGPSTYNQRSAEKMKADEGLGSGATISAVLYANMNHSEWKTDYPNWTDRYKQMIKKWRTLTAEQKAPYLQQARDNRSALRMKKQQQDQEKVALQQKSAREAEQERQWKQLQAIRQQQQQQQQHVIQEQRVQAIARVQRGITDINQPFTQEVQNPELSPVTSPSPNSRQFTALGLTGDMNTEPFTQQSAQKHNIAPFKPRATPDPYAQQPATPRPQFSMPRSNVQNFAINRPEPPEINNHLRDLLQRQQFKKLDEHVLVGQGQQRLWPPENQDSDISSATATSASDNITFRQPLPPSGITRPRVTVPVSSAQLRQPNPVIGLRMQSTERMQTLDPRMRLLIQQQQQQNKQRLAQPNGSPIQQQTFQVGSVRLPAGVQYEQLLQRPQLHQPRTPEQVPPRMQLIQNQSLPTRTVGQTSSVSGNAGSPSLASGPNDPEIPDNVTAELEKLEQESGTMVELHGVGDILGLGDDDDELLAEMGADFNILEYADPELGALAGEKTNILDNILEEEFVKKEKVVARPLLPPTSIPQKIKAEPMPPVVPPPSKTPSSQSSPMTSQPPPLAVSQPQSQIPVFAHQSAPVLQQIHQQMVQQVLQAAAQNRPMPPGSKLQTPDGVIGIVSANNSVSLQVPPNYSRILMTQVVQNQKLQMRVGQSVPRMINAANHPLHQQNAGIANPQRINAPGPPPPPPPYPGPPPPYPGLTNSQQQEQPLLLEDLVEQEKREQEKQNQNQSGGQEPTSSIPNSESALLSDQDFERLKADVFSPSTLTLNTAPSQVSSTTNPPNQWQPHLPTPQSTAVQPPQDTTPKIQVFNVNLIPAPPLPPENIVTELDKQAQVIYEQWLNHQNNVLSQQLRYYETEVNKLRKSRKSLISKRRQLSKSGNQLADADANSLQRIGLEQPILQKHLDSSRKQMRQHGMLIQVYMKEYRSKQVKQQPVQVTSPHLMNQQGQSPLGPPASSPLHHPGTTQSPMMSPTASPLTQHTSPLHSPGQIINHSPGPGSVSNIIQSPNSIPGSNMSPLQPSPRIGTPHSQGDSPVQSPSQICLPPPAPRMTSPQHRRVVTSPVTYSSDIRPGTPQMRYVRTPIEHSPVLQQRVASRLASPNYQQKPGSPSPLNSPPPQQINITQQIFQKQLQQQVLMQQQNMEGNQNESTIAQFQRAAQIVKQRNMARQQVQQQHQQQSQQQQQQTIAQPQPLTPQQHQLMIQQQHQLAKQQQQHIAHLQMHPRLTQQVVSQPKSPMPPKSPLVQQIMSPHSMPPSPMPPRSPMVQFNNQSQTPNSPIARSPVFHQGLSQTPSSPMHHQPQSPMAISPMLAQMHSPMGTRRPPSNPAIPDRPTSVENPCTPRASYTPDHLQGGGGGNPHNPNNPIPALPSYGHFGYIKLGLRGGSPMWNYGRGAKRVPTPPGSSKEPEKAESEQLQMPKAKKESHLSKVSILKKKSKFHFPGKSSTSLVSTDYNEFDDSSNTPPVTPPPTTSRMLQQKFLSNKTLSLHDSKDCSHLIVSSPEQKPIHCSDILEYDDDNNTVLSNEISLNSAIHNDCEDMSVMETLSQSDLTDVMLSPLENVQLGNEYFLYHGNVVDIGGDEQDEGEEYLDDNMHIVIRSPTTSDDEYIMQGKTKRFDQDLSAEQLLSISETPESPETEEIHLEPSPELDDFEESESSTDPSLKMCEEQISTKEDFEELIDEGSRHEKIIKTSVVNISEFHKYASSTCVTSQHGSTIQGIKQSNHGSDCNRVQTQLPQKLLYTKPVLHAIANTSKIETKFVTNTSTKSNVINSKVSTSVAPVITIVSATNQISTILPSGFTVPVLSANAVRQLANVKVISKPSSSISLAPHETSLPKKIFEDDSISPDSSNCGDEKKDCFDEEFKTNSPPSLNTKPLSFLNSEGSLLKDKHTDCNIHLSQVGESLFSNEIKLDKLKEPVNRKFENLKLSTLIAAENIQRGPSPVISKTSSPVIIHNTTELKMTAQVIQESQGIQIQGRSESDMYEQGSDDTKSVVISIPSPTPSQEQMLDNITLQALENRRRDGLSSEFGSFEDVLDMFENIAGEAPTVLEDIKDKRQIDNNSGKISVENKIVSEKITVNTKKDLHSLISINSTKPSNIPQLSPLSQPTDLTTNMANASQQLRTLLSLHTTPTTTSTNTESNTKSFQKLPFSTVMSSSSSTISSRIMHQVSQNSLSSSSTVIVPNMKSKMVSVKATLPSSNAPLGTLGGTTVGIHSTSTIGFMTNRTVGGIQLMHDHPKLAPVSTVSGTTSAVVTLHSNTNFTSSIMSGSSQKSAVTTVTTQLESITRKPSLTLTAMLQSHPAAVPTTKTSADTITAASLLGNSIALSRSGFTTSLVQAQPNVVLSPSTNANANISFQNNSKISVHIPSSAPSLISTAKSSMTNLLHTQLTKVLKTKAALEGTNDPKLDKFDVKETSCEDVSNVKHDSNIVKTISNNQASFTNRMEDSQNVLLKKLLQNTGCASTQSVINVTQPSISTSAAITSISCAEKTPTLSSLLPATIKSEPSITSVQVKSMQRMPIRETSFVSNPVIIPTTPISASPSATTQLHIDVKKCLPPSRTPSRDELLSPQTPRSSCSQDSSLQTPPLIIKKEPSQITLQQTLTLSTAEVKKEFMDETSQHSEVSDHSRSDAQVKEEMDLDITTEKMLLDQKEELKKQKRRMYQQKRRQNQILNKEAAGQPKKRPRKSSKVDEDYDTYIDGILTQLRTLPPMNVVEPILSRNYGVVPIFGAGDLSKLGTKDYDSRYGDLKGCYGDAQMPDCLDFYDTKPYGDLEPSPEKPPASTQRGFYDKEFPPMKFDNEEYKRFDLFCREDSPDSIVSSSSPECPFREPLHKFFGLKLIDEEDEEEDKKSKGRISPVVPIITPIAIRLKPLAPIDDIDGDKENRNEMSVKSKLESSQNAAMFKDSGNVTVTLTLTSSAAEDIMGVLRDLANILHIPAPTSYQIVERTSTPPSQKLGLYRTKGKDGKEGAPIDIQSILNGAAKFCKHCDVVILSNMIRKKISELPFLYKDSEIIGDGDDLYFCSSTCYMQFAVMHRSSSITEAKAAAIIDHLSQKDGKIEQKKQQIYDNQKQFNENIDLMSDFKVDINTYDDKSLSIFNRPFKSVKPKNLQDDSNPCSKTWKGVKYKSWSQGCIQPTTKFKRPTDKETMELLYKLGITVTPPKNAEDCRKCMFCLAIGDSVADGPGRLLNYDVDKWVHLNCALWSEGVYETVNGALMNLENAIRQGLTSACIHCNNFGATVRCFKTRCSSIYHLNCAVKDSCVFYKNKTTYCSMHVPKNEKDNELTTLSVSRRVYINRDENRQVAAIMHHSETSNLLRVGSLIFLSVGQLLPHQLQNFHTSNYIYPIGYKIVRFYWSMRHINKRCRYICSIHELMGRPEFRVIVQEPPEEDIEFKDFTPRAIWVKIVEQLANLRNGNECVQVFPKFVNGEDLFGLTEPAVVRVLESLPGIDTLTDYKFKYGRNPLLELPLAINPSGAARTEPRLKNQLHWKRPHTQRSAGSSLRPLFGTAPTGSLPTSFSEAATPYSKQFVHSKSSQYKKMKQEWKNNVYLARSKIQGLGLYSARDLEKHTMVIEYIGELIRTELAEIREKQYEAKNRGIYMFRLDEERVVDATLSGGLARYINHSCNPNCVAEIVEVDRDLRIIIFTKRRIQRGEELSYDYKFDIEDDQHKISCMCGAPNCRKWMN